MADDPSIGLCTHYVELRHTKNPGQLKSADEQALKGILIVFTVLSVLCQSSQASSSYYSEPESITASFQADGVCI